MAAIRRAFHRWLFLDTKTPKKALYTMQDIAHFAPTLCMFVRCVAAAHIAAGLHAEGRE